MYVVLEGEIDEYHTWRGYLNYYPKPACYTETVLSKLGGGNSALLTGNQ